MEGKKGQIILFLSLAFSPHFVLLVPVPLGSCYELVVAWLDVLEEGKNLDHLFIPKKMIVSVA